MVAMKVIDEFVRAMDCYDERHKKDDEVETNKEVENE
jgi:hypothetical protein